MQPFDTNSTDSDQPMKPKSAVDACRTDDLPDGSSMTIELPDGRALALYNVSGEFYATESSCPHQGAPLADGFLCEHVIECGLHGWQFDVRTGECLTVPEKLETYEVVVEDGLIKIMV
jgi:3-phenylpropionate/trans-cinnamate dioxygenase ferredoxin component